MEILLNLCAGVAMLTWGIYIVKSGMMRTFSYQLNSYISLVTNSKLWIIRALFTGFFTTALVQSSNATAMLVASFISKGVLTLTPSLVIMLGANLGSATMARILSFDLSFLSPLSFIIGIFLFLRFKQEKIGKIGRIFIGLGVILLSLKMIVTSTKPVSASYTVSLILSSLEGELTFAIIFGALLAIICYSSLAAIILTSALVVSKEMSLLTAYSLVIGANLGSCALEILGALSHGADAKRVMFCNFLFKLSIAFLAIFSLDYIINYKHNLDDKDAVIWFHVLFNAATVILMLPFTKIVSRIACFLIKDANTYDIDESKPKNLDRSMLDNPSLALSNAIRETLRLGGFLHEMLNLFQESITGKTSHSGLIEARARLVESVSHNIKKNLSEIEVDNGRNKEIWYQLLASIVSCTQAADLIKRMQKEINVLNESRDFNFSAYVKADLINLCKIVNENLSLSLNALMTGIESDIDIVRDKKILFKEKCDIYAIKQLSRVKAEVGANDTDALSLTLISDLRQLNSLFAAIAESRHTHKKLLLVENEEEAKNGNNEDNRQEEIET